MSWNIFVELLTCYGVIYKVGCVLTFYNGLIIEARYTSVLKICEHKRCHVNQFSAAKSKWKLWRIFMRIPLQTERAVHLKAAVLYLQRLTHTFGHLQETSSMQLWSASGSCELPQVPLLLYGVYCPPIIDQPQLVGGGSSDAGSSIWPHTSPPWYRSIECTTTTSQPPESYHQVLR